MDSAVFYPHAADQTFGVRLATDEELLDQLVDVLDAASTPPRAAGKAPIDPAPSSGETVPPGAAFIRWLRQLADRDHRDGAAVMAKALDDAAESSSRATFRSASEKPRDDREGSRPAAGNRG